MYAKICIFDTIRRPSLSSFMMYICIYVYMYMHIYVYICIYVYMYIYMCICVYMEFVYMYMCIYVYLCICTYTCVYVCILNFLACIHSSCRILDTIQRPFLLSFITKGRLWKYTVCDSYTYMYRQVNTEPYLYRALSQIFIHS